MSITENKTKLYQISAVCLLVKYPHLYSDVKNLLRKECFTDDKYAEYFECFFSIVGRGHTVNMTTVQDYYYGRGLPEFYKANEQEIQRDIVLIRGRDCSEDICKTHVHCLYAIWYKNNLSFQLHTLAEQLRVQGGAPSVDDLYSQVVEFTKCYQPDSVHDEKPEAASDVMDEVIKQVQNSNFCSKGVDAGFPELQKMCNGFVRGTVTCFLSRMKEGKSMLLMNMGVEAALKGTPVLVLDAEMTKTETHMRMLAKLSGVPTSEIKSGEALKNPSRWAKVCEAAKKAPNKFWWMSVAGKSVDQYLTIIKKWVTEHVGYNAEGQANDCLVIFDYIKLTSGDLRDNMKDQEWKQLGDIATKIKETAVTLGVPVLTAIQANREYVKTGAGTTSVGGSDRVSMYIDTLIDYSSKEDIELAEDKQDAGYGANPGTKKMKILISRNAEATKSGDYLSIIFDGATATVSEYAVRAAFRKMDIPNRNKNGKTRIGKQPAANNKTPVIQSGNTPEYSEWDTDEIPI
jgi:replicative DNA helicase